ncbi:hypothetical protein Taro_005178 [Colocasia esculenta]|uniref:Secreted protein n=1 Tax=Colocasia esculenta TaxID=4460 RepID=A0A843TRN2_COLES|nr:hypothetical protein [Colocasia esculenta]
MVVRLTVDLLAVFFLVWRKVAGKSRCGAPGRLQRSALLLGLSRCPVCHVASLVERCDACLWLLSAWRWLVVSSGEVLPEFFSVGSGGRLLRACLCRAMLPQGLRYAASVGLAGAFWRVFPERFLHGSGGGSSQDRPLSLLAEVLPRSALMALDSFRRRFSPKLPCVCFGRVVRLAVCLAIALANLSR